MAKQILLVLLTVALSACAVPPISPTPLPAPDAGKVIGEIAALAVGSSCAAYRWKDRGRAPKGYMAGMGLTYARAICRPDALTTRPLVASDKTDALYWYNSNFKAIGQTHTGERAMLRRVYTLLVGLGMRESSGRHCSGRDASATNTSADTAEAGLFQASYNSRGFSKDLVGIMNRHQVGSPACLLDVFKEGVSCRASDLIDHGTGPDVAFQTLSKQCPAFAAEYTAALIRVSGGTTGHFGPLRRKEAELRPECGQMLVAIEAIVDANPAVCGALL